MTIMSEKRDAYVQKMKAKLDEWNADIAKLEAKARQKEADARADVERRIEKLKAKRKTVEDDLDQLLRSGEYAWEDLKAGIDSAADALGEALRSARSHF
jgi:septal ring factor EnvC (AmiA/AmiB activator)